MAKLVGQGLLVCSRTSEVDPSRMHLIEGADGHLQLAAGDRWGRFCIDTMSMPDKEAWQAS